MTPELKQKWIEALRSGKYKQGRTVLRNLEDQFCCLGVLCDVAGLKWQRSDVWSVDDMRSVLSVKQLDEFGLDQYQMDKLVIMNDGGNTINDPPKSFEEIANWIEENVC